MTRTLGKLAVDGDIRVESDNLRIVGAESAYSSAKLVLVVASDGNAAYERHILGGIYRFPGPTGRLFGVQHDKIPHGCTREPSSSPTLGVSRRLCDQERAAADLYLGVATDQRTSDFGLGSKRRQTQLSPRLRATLQPAGFDSLEEYTGERGPHSDPASNDFELAYNLQIEPSAHMRPGLPL